jgi:hypothetical protein
MFWWGLESKKITFYPLNSSANRAWTKKSEIIFGGMLVYLNYSYIFALPIARKTILAH